jgi:sugar phosphate isomerase/epimerase
MAVYKMLISRSKMDSTHATSANIGRRLFLGTLGSAVHALGAGRKYAPLIVCNTYYWNQLFSTPYRFITAKPDPLIPNPDDKSRLVVSTGGTVWTDQEWNTALSDVQYAGYRRIEVLAQTLLAKPVEDLVGLLDKYGVIVNHIWHKGGLYPKDVAERTMEQTKAVLDTGSRLKTQYLFFDPFGDRGPLSAENAREQNRGLDRIGREAKKHGMKLCMHNHQGPMRYGAKEWLGVLHDTDPDLVWICLDMDWTWQAGTDPFPLLYEAGDSGRLAALHLRTQRQRIADETMQDGGDIDYRKCARYLKKIRFDGVLVEETEWMKETKVTRPPRENKRIARMWCEKVFDASAKK